MMQKPHPVTFVCNWILISAGCLLVHYLYAKAMPVLSVVALMVLVAVQVIHLGMAFIFYRNK